MFIGKCRRVNLCKVIYLLSFSRLKILMTKLQSKLDVEKLSHDFYLAKYDQFPHSLSPIFSRFYVFNFHQEKHVKP